MRMIMMVMNINNNNSDHYNMNSDSVLESVNSVGLQLESINSAVNLRWVWRTVEKGGEDCERIIWQAEFGGTKS